MITRVQYNVLQTEHARPRPVIAPPTQNMALSGKARIQEGSTNLVLLLNSYLMDFGPAPH